MVVIIDGAMSLGYTSLLFPLLFRSICAKCHVHVGDFWVKRQVVWSQSWWNLGGASGIWSAWSWLIRLMSGCISGHVEHGFCSLIHKYKVQSFLGTSVSLSMRDEGLTLLTSQSFGRRMPSGGSEAAGLMLPCCQLALWQKH